MKLMQCVLSTIPLKERLACPSSNCSHVLRECLLIDPVAADIAGPEPMHWQDFYAREFGFGLPQGKGQTVSERIQASREAVLAAARRLEEQDPKKLKEDRRHLEALYDAQIAAADAGLGELFTALRSMDLMDRTLLVIVSDHGQSFGERGLYAVHRGVHREAVRMVWIVRDPRAHRRKRVISDLAEGIDVLPTILDLLERPIPEGIQGRSRAAAVRERIYEGGGQDAAVSMGPLQFAIRTARWLFIRFSISCSGAPLKMLLNTMSGRQLLSGWPLK